MKKFYLALVLSTITVTLLFWFLNGEALAINATFTVSVLPPSELIEGQKNLIFVLRRTGDLSGVTVLYKMSGVATSGQDYSAPAGSAQFAQGQETFNVSITTLNDTIPEKDENVIMTIIASPIAGSYQIGNPAAATATIKDDEPVVTISTLQQFLVETAGTLTVNPGGFQISRTGPTASALSVDIRIDGTALNGTDYNLVSTPVQIPTNASQVVVPIAVKNDLIKDPDEIISITILENANRYRVGSAASASTTIRDDDPPRISLSIQDANAEESNLSTATVQVVRSGDATQTLTVNYTVNPAGQLIVGIPASSGADFAPLSGSVSLPRFRTSADIVITPVDDSVIEGTEKVLIHLSPNTAYDLGTNNETISILDNDFATVTVTPTDGIASESGTDPGTFTFSRTGPTTSGLTVRFSISTAGTNQATRDVDYSLPVRVVSNSVSIPSGQASLDVAITPVDDSQQESQEQVTISIVQDPAYAVGNNSTATIFIADND